MAEVATRLTAYIGTWNGPPPTADDPTLQVYRCFQTAGAVLVEWPAIESGIMQDVTLSEQGKTLALKKAIADLSPRLDRASAIVASAKAQLAKDEAALVGASKPNDTVGEMRAIEIRAWFSRLDSSQRNEVIRAALDEAGNGANADPETLAAILAGPASMVSVPPAIAARIKSVMLQRRAPDKVAAQEAMSNAVQVAGFAIDRVRGYINQRANLTPTSPQVANA